jgi:inositol oxygenase
LSSTLSSSALLTSHDEEMFERAVLKFNPYDLYSKGLAKPDLQAIKPYYDDLFAEFFPARISW